MSSHIRQRKSPYFYVRKGSGFVLLDNHEETNTRYKTESEAKKAVLALNDAWRAKHGTRAKHAARTNPGPMMYSIMRAQEEARKKAKRNPAPVVAYIKQMGAWWSTTERQWAALVAAGVSGKPYNLNHLTTRLKNRPSGVSARGASILPVVQPLDFSTPEEWEEVDEQVRRMQAERARWRRNPGASGDVELILWARPKGQTDALHEQPIYTVGRTMEDIERVKKLAAKDGWHTFRVQTLNLSKPFDAQAAFAGGVRGARRRNPRKHDQSEAQARVLHLFSTATVGAGRALDAFADRLGHGEALSALDLEDAVIAAEARLEDAEYELKTNRIAEYRAGLREERDQFRQLLNAIKALKPSQGARRNPRKYDESRDDAGFRKVSDLKKGEFFKRKPDARKVYRKGDYDRAERKYECGDTDDISRAIYLKGDALVYVGFDY